MDYQSVIVGIIVSAVLFSLVGAGVFLVSQTGQTDSPIEQTTATPTPAPATDVPASAAKSKAGAAELKQSFGSEYKYDSRVFIKDDGQVVLYYNSTAQSGSQLKEEMRGVALLYADVAANNTDVGSLTVQANGVMLTIPVDSAIAHGDDDINEEAYFETVRWSGAE
jgi:hypothetical protein